MARDGEKLFVSLVRNGSTTEFLRLREDLFVDPAEVQIHRYIRNHYRSHGQLPDLETMQTDCSIRNIRTPEPISYYINKVYTRAKFVGVRNLVRPLTDSLRDGETEVTETVVRDMRLVLDRFSPAPSATSLHDATDQVIQQYIIAHNTLGLSGVDTGCHILNQQTDGWQGGDLIFIVARMFMGKTWYLLNMIRGAYEAGHSMLVVSMEMPVVSVTRRYVSLLTGINPDYIKRGELSTSNFERLNSLLDDMESDDRLTFVSGDMNQRVSELDAMIEERRPDIVYIDGAYLMKPEDRRLTKRVEKLELVVSELKTICNLRNIPIVCTSQMNRMSKGKGKEGTLETIGYSDSIGTDASIVLTLLPGEGDEENSHRYIKFLKGRDGESGSYRYNFNFSPMNFDFCPETSDNTEYGEVDDYDDSSGWNAE